MKKAKSLFLSLIVIVGVVGAVVLGTRAYFSDTETSAGNTFTTGTIDIAVDDENPWSRTEPYELTDMKPSQTEYIEFEVKNVGTNPVNLYKKIDITDHQNDPVSEPECEAEGGSWNNGQCEGNTPVDNLEDVILYDLKVELYNEEDELVWHQMVYDEDVTVGEIQGEDIFLGMIPVNWRMKVTQSYHMDPAAGNAYQGDGISFNITLTGEQLKGELVLENKSGDPDWRILHDSTQAVFAYKVKDKTLNYSLTASGLEANTEYSLIHYVDPWPGNGVGSVGEISSGSTDGSGNLTVSGEVELNANLTNAKVWLVPSELYDATEKKVTGWSPSRFLFETGLIDYYDSDL